MYARAADVSKKTPLPLFVVLGFLLVIVAAFIFWLRMLIDCIKSKIEEKTLWIILLVFLNILGAILYYFIVKNKKTT